MELVLVRHGKSDWGDPGIEDHERPLNARGMRDAPTMAERFAAADVSLDRILSSTAVRANTTAQVFGERLGIEVESYPGLYLAPASALLATAAATDAASVMVVAHDPGLSDLAAQLSGGEITRMPTCAVARFAWRVDDWDEVEGLAPDEWWFDAPQDART